MAQLGFVALLDTLTFPETLTILVIALVVLGPEKLPGMARTMGEWMSKLKRMTANLQAEVRDVMDDPQMQPLRELGEFAAQPKKKLAELALAAEAEAAAEVRADAGAEGEPAAEGGDRGLAEEGDVVVPVMSTDEVAAADAATDAPARIVAAGPEHPMLAQSPPEGPAPGSAHVVDP